MSYQPSQAAGVKARVKAIMQSPEAASRRQLADHLAFSTDMPAAQAIALMRAAPVEAASAPAAAAPMSAETIAAKWATAVERVNSRIRQRIMAQQGH